MQEWLFDQTWIGGAAVILVAVATAGYKFSRWTGYVSTTLKSIEENVQKGFEEIRTTLYGRLDTRLVSEARSPIQLSAFGRDVSATGSAHEWARAHAPNLEADLADKEEFEIFDLCAAYVEKLFGDDSKFQRTVQATAYQHCTEPAQVLEVYQIELRDRLLRSPHQVRSSTSDCNNHSQRNRKDEVAPSRS